MRIRQAGSSRTACSKIVCGSPQSPKAKQDMMFCKGMHQVGSQGDATLGRKYRTLV